MAKVLLTKKNVNEYISKDGKNIYVTSNMIVTPGAKDVIRNKGIIIVYGEEPEVKEVEKECVEPSKLEVLQNMIVQMLKTDFNITDKASIDKACKLILDEVNIK